MWGRVGVVAPPQCPGQGALVGTQLCSPSLGCALCLLAYKMLEPSRGPLGPLGQSGVTRRAFWEQSWSLPAPGLVGQVMVTGHLCEVGQDRPDPRLGLIPSLLPGSQAQGKGREGK